jgi:hypothetical protein
VHARAFLTDACFFWEGRPSTSYRFSVNPLGSLLKNKKIKPIFNAPHKSRIAPHSTKLSVLKEHHTTEVPAEADLRDVHVQCDSPYTPTQLQIDAIYTRSTEAQSMMCADSATITLYPCTRLAHVARVYHSCPFACALMSARRQHEPLPSFCLSHQTPTHGRGQGPLQGGAPLRGARLRARLRGSRFPGPPLLLSRPWLF